MTALLTFQDANEQYHTPREDSTPVNTPVSSVTVPDKGPPPPPKPAPRTGVARIAEMQMLSGEYNEINVEDEGGVEEYAQYCLNLLQVLDQFRISFFSCQND